MAYILAIPILVLVLVLQTAVVSRLPMIDGTADLMLVTIIAWALQNRVKNSWFWSILAGVMVSLISAVPFFIPLVSYLIATFIARFFQRMIWQTPIMAMFVVTVVGTLIYHGLTIVVLQFTGASLPIDTTLSQVTIPSMILNLLISLPVYIIMADFSKWVYPVETE